MLIQIANTADFIVMIFVQLMMNANMNVSACIQSMLVCIQRVLAAIQTTLT